MWCTVPYFLYITFSSMPVHTCLSSCVAGESYWMLAVWKLFYAIIYKQE